MSEKIKEKAKTNINTSLAPRNIRKTNLAGGPGSPRFLHENTQTSKNVRAIEEQLMTAIAKLVDIMRDEPYAISNPSLTIRKYDTRIREIIHAGIYHVYIEGIQYVSDFRQVPAYMNETDLGIINNQVEKYTTQFWLRFNAFISGRNTVRTSLDFSPKSPLSTVYVVSSLATALATRVLALSTLAKARQLLQQQRSPYYRLRQAAIKKIETELPIGLEPTGDPQLPAIQVIMVYITARDDRVCAICSAYDGQEYDLNDQSIPVPPDDTHNNCRCRIMMQESDPFAGGGEGGLQPDDLGGVF